MQGTITEIVMMNTLRHVCNTCRQELENYSPNIEQLLDGLEQGLNCLEILMQPTNMTMNIGRNKSIYISSESKKIIGTFEETAFCTDRVNSIIMRYGEITGQNRPKLTVNEWMYICDALYGFDLNSGNSKTDIVHEICNIIVDPIIKKELGDKWRIDEIALAMRICCMPYIPRCVIIDVICRFWQNHVDCSCECYKECLENCGAKIK